MNKLVLLRHGESVWNLENVFTGSDTCRDIIATMALLSIPPERKAP